MAVGGATALTMEELERALRAAEPGVLLVMPRTLRRVIRYDRDITRLGLRVPHRKSLVIGREALRAAVDADDLGLPPGVEPPEVAVLLARPKAEALAALTREDALLRAWRFLFHARVHRALEFDEGRPSLDRSGVRERIDRIGQVAFDEIRTVLRADDWLLPPADDRTVLLEFAALYLELRHFAPQRLARVFPSVREPDEIDRLLAEDLDVERLLHATRPPGAPGLPAWGEPDDGDEPDEAADEAPEPTRQPRSGTIFQHLMTRADRASARGNVVRAAILRGRAARVAPAGSINRAQDTARRELDRLSERLARAVGFDGDEARALRRGIGPLLPKALGGLVSREARLLYDLQKVCVDHEREVSRADLVEWALTFGRRPVRRPLPLLREVLMLKHLRQARRRLERARVGEPQRVRLGVALADAVERVEHGLCDTLRPRIASALDQAGLGAANVPERVALAKLVEELGDQVIERGYLAMSDLRDAISRSNRKLPDVAGVGAFLRGGPLLRADRLLAEELDGVYHRGEIYLRWLQRLSALAFGTPGGRFVTKFIALPLGGAFVLLEGGQHLVNLLWHALTGFELELFHPVSLAFYAALLLGLLYWAEFRAEFARAWGRIFRVLGRVLFDLPARLLDLPPIRALRRSRAFRVLARSLLLPAAITAVSWLLMPRSVRHGEAAVLGVASLFFALSLLLNSRLGRDLGESAVDSVGRGLHRLRIGVLPAIYRFVMDVFGRLLELIDRLLYTVDEYLRFRSGQGRLALASKAVLGVAWFFVTYVVRFCVNLLVEPQINPIKHFPVVTVSHKILLPFAPSVRELLIPAFGAGRATAITGTVFLLLPGVFGFLVWELKENWRLYEANRPRSLTPVLVGHHGETLARLLRPGFHSGTLPKLFQRLRRAERKPPTAGRRKAIRRATEALHHVEETVRHFVDRELVALLERGGRLGNGHVATSAVEVGSNQIRVELVGPGSGGEPLVIDFDEQSGWLLAGITEPGWLDRLDPDRRRAVADALAGWYKMAGVDMVREQVRKAIEPPGSPYDINAEGLVIWPGGDYDREVVRPLRDASSGDDEARRLLFRNLAIPWADWVAAWDAPRGRPAAEFPPLADGQAVLPERPARKAERA